MKNVKIVIWFTVMLIIQTVVAHYIRIYDVSPIVILPFVLCTALLEDSFRYCASIGIIGGILSGTFMGRNFFISTLIVSAASIILFNCRRKMKYVPNIVKAVIWTALSSFIWEILSYFYLYHSFAEYGQIMINKTIVSVIYNSAFSVIIYLLLKKTVYNKEEKERKLI